MPVNKRPATAHLVAVAQKRQAVRRRLQIEVCGIDGRSLELKRDRDDEVATVKPAIAKQWGVPARFQKLAHEAHLVRDSDRIGKFCTSAEDTLKLSFVVTLEGVSTQLGSTADSDSKLRALDDLHKMGPRGASALQPVCGCLRDVIPKVRTKALTTIKKMSTNKKHIIDVVVASFTEWVNPESSPFIGKMEWAIKILNSLAEDENDYAVAAVASMVLRLPIFEQDWCAGVLKGIAQDPFQAADKLLSTLLEQDARPEARELPDAEEVLDAFVYCRSAKQIKQNDMRMHFVTALTKYVQEPDEKTRFNALLLLPRFGNEFFAQAAPHNWDDATQSLYSNLILTLVGILNNQASSANLVEATLKALGSVVFKYDKELIACMLTFISVTASEAINSLALRVLRYCAELGDERTIAAASRLLTSTSNKVRSAAMKTLSQIVEHHYEDDDDSFSDDADFSDF